MLSKFTIVCMVPLHAVFRFAWSQSPARYTSCNVSVEPRDPLDDTMIAFVLDAMSEVLSMSRSLQQALVPASDVSLSLA